MNNFDDGGVPVIPREKLDALLAELIAEHPAHRTDDTASAARALARYADAAMAAMDWGDVSEAMMPLPDGSRHAWDAVAARLVDALRTDAKAPGWQADDHRYAPKLSKWLRGRTAMLALPRHQRAEPALNGKQAVEAHAVACGLGTFEQWQVSEYGRTGCVQSWQSFRKAVDAKRGVQA